jgi:hypothetical protein
MSNNAPTLRYFDPPIIAHDTARSRDRSTAVIGGRSPWHFPMQPSRIGIGELIELPEGLYGSARANELVKIDNRYDNNALIVADLSNDASYAEDLHRTFGPRVIGVQITRQGDGMQATYWKVPGDGHIAVYPVGRSYLLELFHKLLNSGQVSIPHNNPMMRRAAEQLMALETELRQSGAVYTCPAGQHDDLGMSCAMLIWAAHHPHLEHWKRTMERSHRSALATPRISNKAWS